MSRSRFIMCGRSPTFRRPGRTVDVRKIYILATWVHGWVYHVETGLIEDVMLETSLPGEMK